MRPILLSTPTQGLEDCIENIWTYEPLVKMNPTNLPLHNP